MLDQYKEDARAFFERCIHTWCDLEDWKHHWSILGIMLCNALETGDFEPTEPVMERLKGLLGAEHERVELGYQKIALIQSRW